MNLNQVTIPSLDVEKAVAFYKTLGLKIIVEALPEYVRLLCPDGDATFSIHKVEQLNPNDGISIYFEVDDLEKTVSDLEQKGITFNTEILKQSWLWDEARLKDLDGNNIIIYRAGENRKNPPWRIN
ncbi:VOC family protein [Winogradskyella sp.]|uniref:VOC family protein n=1 Tax=Winogradskyella sp. TaxID=1883156 RepID=UPI003F6D6A1E